MNETESKYYTYTQNGILINRIEFKDTVSKYGVPIAVSANGLCYIFKQTVAELEY